MALIHREFRHEVFKTCLSLLHVRQSLTLDNLLIIIDILIVANNNTNYDLKLRLVADIIGI